MRVVGEGGEIESREVYESHVCCSNLQFAVSGLLFYFHIVHISGVCDK